MKKHLSVLLALALLTALLTGCAGGASSAGVSASSTAPPAESTAEQAPAVPAKAITIIHTNDVHGYDSAIDALSGEETEMVIGLDRGAALRDAYAAEGPVFLLAAGDATQGIFFVTASKGEAAVEIMNAAGYDAMTLDNHEFDYGWFQLVNLIEGMEFPALSQLDDDEARQTGNLAPYTVIERDGVRLGVFGLTTPETQFKSDGGFGRDFGTVEAMTAHAGAIVKKLREEEKADYVVCLAHLGVEDIGYGTSYDIRDNVADKAQITSTGAYGARVGVARLEGGDDVPQVALENLDKEAMLAYTPDAAVTGVIDKWAAGVAEEGNTVVAQVPFAITVARENERTGETVMGDIITDAMREASGADIALQNGGGIRDQQLAAGGDLYTMLVEPFSDQLPLATPELAPIEAALVSYLAAHQSELSPNLQGRVATLGEYTQAA